MISFNSEKELELCLMDNPKWLIDKLFVDDGAKFYRQVEIPPYGRMDILGIYQDGDYLSIKVIELKNKYITLSDIAQLSRYLRYFELIEGRLPFKDVVIEGVILGPVNFLGDDVFLAQSLENITVFDLTIDPMTGLDAKIIDGYKIAAEITNLSSVSNILGVDL